MDICFFGLSQEPVMYVTKHQEADGDIPLPHGSQHNMYPACLPLIAAWEYRAILAAVYLIFFQDYLQSNRIRLPVSLKHQLQPLFSETDGLLEFISKTNPTSKPDRSIACHVSDLHTTCPKAKNGFLIYSEGKFMKCSISY